MGDSSRVGGEAKTSPRRFLWGSEVCWYAECSFFRLCTEGSLPTALLGQSQQVEQSVAACEEAAEIVSFINIRLVNIYTQLEKVAGTAQVRDYLVAAMIQTKIWEDDTIKRATIFDEMFTSHEVVYEMRKEDFDAGNS